MATPAEELDRAFRDRLAKVAEPVEGPSPVTPRPFDRLRARTEGHDWDRLFTAQATSRHLDLVARELQARGLAYYTIGSAGHESNAMVALATRVGDPALLHYRSGGFYAARAGLLPGGTPATDVLQGLMCLADEPIAGGRHKVFGHPDLAIIPQTSTIASHLPRAVGLAIALQRADRLGVDHEWPADALVVCSFGDASANHSTATGAINTAINTAYRGLPVPILFVCEDNGLGISVRTPAGWIEHAYGSRPGLDYLAADGADPATAWPVIEEAVRRVRDHRRPVFLHLRTVRYLAHAGSDAEIGYRKPSEIETAYDLDPLLGTARAMIGNGSTPAQVLATYDRIGAEVRAEADRLTGARQLTSAAEIIEPLAPRSPDRVAALAAQWAEGRSERPATLAESINTTLSVIMEQDRRVITFGEDVGVKGGVYGVTRGLARRFGTARVFDTILDEQSILGLALGAGLAGLVPIPEIQYLAYLHNAEDQLRGEAATLSFFSRGRWRNPLVIRIAGLAYQKGFGGHFHNDDAVAVLRDIPGIVVACPSRADDAPALLRTCVAAAATDGTVAVFLEPIALYHTRDLHTDGDGGWLGVDHGEPAPIGRARTVRTGAELTMITFGNGVPMSLRAAESLAGQGIEATVLDLRWLAPLPAADAVAAARSTGRVLVVDETRHSGGVGEGVITALVEGGFTGPMARVSSTDSFVPLGAAARHVLLDTDEIIKAATDLAGKERS
ncbi:transketolase C-terminal domain-containing protein [Microlunatus sp. GCM10028923]|uniref:transketolase C-terminal domain-containing protein n=1 Tax=Microlunatus sp. GCM10028923 TaxID=3273400 RepID=UPI003617110C